MSNPLHDAIEGILAADRARFHMPGHKGKSAVLAPMGDVQRRDITEISGADSLYTADGPLLQTEARLTGLYGTAGSFLTPQGASHGILAALKLAFSPGDKVLLTRCCHAAAVRGMALIDLHPVWLPPGGDGVCAVADPGDVAQALTAEPDIQGVYITSPDYYGNLCDVRAIADICEEHGVPLVVDSAHGAHLAFLKGADGASLHPMAQGATLCVDSAHKTLPALTGAAFLHTSDPAHAAGAKAALALFGSTSPSYPIMESIDLCLGWLASGGAETLAARAAEFAVLRAQLAETLPIVGDDPFKITVNCADYGGGYTALETLREQGMEPEMADENHLVLMLGEATTGTELALLKRALLSLPRKTTTCINTEYIQPQQVLSPRQAVFAQTETLPVRKAAGRISADTICPCPPGVMRVCPGERVSEQIANYIQSTGVLDIKVLK